MSQATQLQIAASTHDPADIQRLAEEIQLELGPRAEVRLETSRASEFPTRSGVEMVVPVLSLAMQGIEFAAAVVTLLEMYEKRFPGRLWTVTNPVTAASTVVDPNASRSRNVKAIIGLVKKVGWFSRLFGR
jgi:hypothetical protein